jgi:hypothetical protein
MVVMNNEMVFQIVGFSIVFRRNCVNFILNILKQPL